MSPIKCLSKRIPPGSAGRKLTKIERDLLQDAGVITGARTTVVRSVEDVDWTGFLYGPVSGAESKRSGGTVRVETLD